MLRGVCPGAALRFYTHALMTSPASGFKKIIQSAALDFAAAVLTSALALAVAHADDRIQIHLDAGQLTLKAD